MTLRLLQLVQDRGIGPEAHKGAAVHVAAMAAAFEALGARVVTVHARDAEDARRQLDAARGDPPDAVYERYALGALEGARLARELDVPHVLEVNAPLLEEARRHRDFDPDAFDDAGDRDLFARASLCVCVSRQVAAHALERGADPERVVVHPNGVDPGLFRPRDDADALRRAAFPELEDPFVVGFHGRLRPWHNLDRIVAASACALEAGVDVGLLCAGRGDFEGVAARALPPDRLRVIPWCSHEELARHVASFHVLPLAYGQGGETYFSPLKLREAMAAGVVPVVPSVGDLPAVVEHGAAGRIVPPDDGAALTAALVELARDPSERARLAARARESASGHTWVAIAEDVLRRVGAPLR